MQYFAEPSRRSADARTESQLLWRVCVCVRAGVCALLRARRLSRAAAGTARITSLCRRQRREREEDEEREHGSAQRLDRQCVCGRDCARMIQCWWSVRDSVRRAVRDVTWDSAGACDTARSRRVLTLRVRDVVCVPLSLCAIEPPMMLSCSAVSLCVAPIMTCH